MVVVVAGVRGVVGRLLYEMGYDRQEQTEERSFFGY